MDSVGRLRVINVAIRCFVIRREKFEIPSPAEFVFNQQRRCRRVQVDTDRIGSRPAPVVVILAFPIRTGFMISAFFSAQNSNATHFDENSVSRDATIETRVVRFTSLRMTCAPRD